MANETAIRLQGWKAIAAFFGRDRSTVARWTRERNLPVHFLPGGKQKSVFAFEHELAAWAMRNVDAGVAEPGQEATLVAAPQDEPIAAQPHRLRASARKRTALWGAGIGATTLLLGLAVHVAAPFARPVPLASPAVMADYVAARDAWARRTPEDIRHAIGLYERLIQREPDFAPARAGLAEAWLIYREYGDVSDARAYGAARVAAQKAASLDPDLPAAHRALGFIDYWWDNDPAAAVAQFRRAIALDDSDAQTHFWFANILADLGEAALAEQQYERARLLSPGSQPIAVEHACAQWQAGKDALALRLLTELEQRYPRDATISNCLAWVHIGRGDIANFARAFSRMAQLRGEPALLRLSRALDGAVARDPATAHRVLIADARREMAAGTRRMRETPAFYASAMGDRAELLELMREAHVLGERWFSPAITRRIAARWKGDAEVALLLGRLRVAPPTIAAE